MRARIRVTVEHEHRQDGGGDRVAQARDQGPLGCGIGAAGDAVKQVVAVDQQNIDAIKCGTRHSATMMHVRAICLVGLVALLAACDAAPAPSPTPDPSPTAVDLELLQANPNAI